MARGMSRNGVLMMDCSQGSLGLWVSGRSADGQRTEARSPPLGLKQLDLVAPHQTSEAGEEKARGQIGRVVRGGSMGER